MSFQQVIVIGNLGGDAEVRYMPSGSAVANFSVAASEKWKDRDGNPGEHTEWFRCALFGPIVERIQQYLTKGKQVMVQGKMRTRKYQDREGIDRYATELRVDEIKLLGSRGGAGSNTRASGQLPTDSSPSPQPGPDDFDDDIPF